MMKFVPKSAAIVLIVAAVLAAGAAGFFLLNDRDARQIKRQAAIESAGERLYAQGAYADAVDALKAEYRATPTERAKRMLSRALLASGDPLSALELLRVDAPLSRPEAAMLRAEGLLRLGRTEEAETEVESFAEIAPGAAALYRARSAFLAGDDAAAKAGVAASLRAGGYAADAWMFRVRTALSENNFAAAEAAEARAASAGAPKRALELLLIERMIRRGDFASADAALGPEDKARADDAYLRALSEAASGDAKAAVLRLRGLEQALAADPRSRLLAAYAREASADVSQAEIEFRRAAESAPRDPVVQDALAAFYLRQGRTDDAAEAIEALSILAPAAARLRQAESHERSGDADSAFAVLVGGEAERIPSRARVLGAAAVDPGAPADRRLDSVAAAAAALRDGAAVDAPLARMEPFSQQALPALLIGELELSAGDPDGALAAFRTAAAAPSFRAALGEARALTRRGDWAAARKRLAAAAAAKPDDLRRRRAAARALLGAGDASAAMALLNAAGDAALRDDRSIGVMVDAALGDTAALGMVADRLARVGRSSGAVAEAYLAAGRRDLAENAARRTLLAKPDDAQALSVYLRASVGASSAEPSAFLAALSRRSPGIAPLQTALDQLIAGAPIVEVAAAVDEAAAKTNSRLLYLTAPDDVRAVKAETRRTLASGATRSGGALLREECLWSGPPECAATPQTGDE